MSVRAEQYLPQHRQPQLLLSFDYQPLPLQILCHRCTRSRSITALSVSCHLLLPTSSVLVLTFLSTIIFHIVTLTTHIFFLLLFAVLVLFFFALYLVVHLIVVDLFWFKSPALTKENPGGGALALAIPAD
jgi:hypothetical protein